MSDEPVVKAEPDSSPAVKVESSAPSTTSSSSSTPASISLSSKSFWERVHTVFNAWRKGGRAFGSIPPPGAAANAPATGPPVDSILLLRGSPPEDEEASYDKLVCVHNYLFGYEFNDTAVVLVRDPDQILVVAGGKKAKLLESLSSDPLKQKDSSRDPLKLVVLQTNKADKNANNAAQLVKAIKASKAGKRIGTIPDKDGKPTALVTSLQQLLKKAALESVDVTAGFQAVLSIKDTAAKLHMREAAEISSKVLKKVFLPLMETVIDEEKKMKQSDMADQVEDAIREAEKLDKKYSSEDVDSCYTPIIQSGGGVDEKFDLRPSAQSSDGALQYESGTTIVVQLGAKYKNFCSNIGRTYFINPVDEQKVVYSLLIDIYIACKKQLKPGTKMSQVYATALKVIKDAKREDLVPCFTKTCGFGIGLEFREGSNLLNDKNQKVIQKGMVFNLCVGFQDLVTKPQKGTNEEARQYAVLIADTIAVNGASEEPDCFTRIPREMKEISYLIGDAAAEQEKLLDEATRKAMLEVTQDEGRRSTRAVNQTVVADDGEKARRLHQEELARRKQEEAIRRLTANEMDKHFTGMLNSDIFTFDAYKSPDDFPPTAKPQKIVVDTANESILLPIHDQIVPFHILTVKNIHKQEEAPYTILRFQFTVPDTPAAQRKAGYVPGMKYVSELSFRSTSNSLDTIYFQARELRKRVQQNLKESDVKKSLVMQEELKLDRQGPVPTLKDCSIRPHLSRKKTTGTLSAQLNGFRFVTTDKIKIDIIYANIKSAFYQPAEDTHNVLIHLELKDPILVDKTKTKKTNFLQFYVEVVESSEDLSTTNRYRDEDGLAEEQEERRRKKKWNERFLQFVKEVEDKLSKRDSDVKLEFDIPYKELAFTGVPAKSQVTIIPTVHSLVALDDTPPLVLNLSDVEIANFERVQFGLKNFDLVFVWKDFNRLPLRIEAIPVKQLEPIKHWLNSCDIVYYESPQNILWKTVMKQIAKDPEGFWSDGGFDIFLRHNAEHYSSDEDEDGEDDEEEDAGEGGEEQAAAPKKKKKKKEESESEYEPDSGDDDDSEEYETPSEEDEDDEDDAEDSEASLGSEEEEGEDWDELEEKTRQADKQKIAKIKAKGGSDAEDFSDEDSEEERRPKKKAAPMPPTKQSTMTSFKKK